MTTLTEVDVEKVALSWLADVGWQVDYGPEAGIVALTRRPF